jgi:hypothetical protein
MVRSAGSRPTSAQSPTTDQLQLRDGDETASLVSRLSGPDRSDAQGRSPSREPRGPPTSDVPVCEIVYLVSLSYTLHCTLVLFK